MIMFLLLSCEKPQNACETYKIVWKLIIETYTIVLHTTHVINIAVYGNIRLAN